MNICEKQLYILICGRKYVYEYTCRNIIRHRLILTHQDLFR